MKKLIWILFTFMVSGFASANEPVDTVQTVNELTGIPGFDGRLNMLLIAGALVIGMIFLLSLKIYQMESGEDDKE